MRKIKLSICLIVGLFIMLAFSVDATLTSEDLNMSKLVNWYAKLLDKSIAFSSDKKNKYFKDSIQVYIDTCQSYNFFNHTRLEPYVCQPILLNKSCDKAIVLILCRTSDLSDERVEIVKYVSARYERNKWRFKIKKGHSDTFHYSKKYPTTSDTEIGINILGRLIQYGYLKLGDIYSEKLFESDMYVM